jgi:hypothetical protein
MDAAVRLADDGLALASAGHVLVSILRRPLTLDRILVMRRESRRMADQGQFVSFSIIEPGAANAASAEVRDASSAFAREFDLVGAAIVIEGTGFRPAATRTLIAGMYLVTKKRYPHKIVQTPTEGATWLSRLLHDSGITQPAAEMLALAESARRALP